MAVSPSRLLGAYAFVLLSYFCIVAISYSRKFVVFNGRPESVIEMVDAVYREEPKEQERLAGDRTVALGCALTSPQQRLDSGLGKGRKKDAGVEDIWLTW